MTAANPKRPSARPPRWKAHAFKVPYYSRERSFVLHYRVCSENSIEWKLTEHTSVRALVGHGDLNPHTQVLNFAMAGTLGGSTSVDGAQEMAVITAIFREIYLLPAHRRWPS
jgi:hypothetical protein